MPKFKFKVTAEVTRLDKFGNKVKESDHVFVTAWNESHARNLAHELFYENTEILSYKMLCAEITE